MTFQRSLRTAPAPLGCFWLGIGPALAGNVGTGGAFALTREGAGVSTFQRSLRPDPAAAIIMRGRSHLFTEKEPF